MLEGNTSCNNVRQWFRLHIKYYPINRTFIIEGKTNQLKNSALVYASWNKSHSCLISLDGPTANWEELPWQSHLPLCPPITEWEDKIKTIIKISPRSLVYFLTQHATSLLKLVAAAGRGCKRVRSDGFLERVPSVPLLPSGEVAVSVSSFI